MNDFGHEVAIRLRLGEHIAVNIAQRFRPRVPGSKSRKGAGGRKFRVRIPEGSFDETRRECHQGGESCGQRTPGLRATAGKARSHRKRFRAAIEVAKGRRHSGILET